MTAHGLTPTSARRPALRSSSTSPISSSTLPIQKSAPSPSSVRAFTKNEKDDRQAPALTTPDGHLGDFLLKSMAYPVILTVGFTDNAGLADCPRLDGVR